MAQVPVPVPIAIVGMACRLPGDVTNTEELWNLLVEGRNVWSPVPPQRYNEAAFYHPNPENDGTTNHRGGHFISPDIAAFDASFFGLSPIEAQAMDPQQRLLLETTYEAFENAGIPIDKARGSNTAVYTAMFTRDYDRNIYKDPVDLPKYQTTGTGDAIASNRISYVFDFRGPSMTLDAGCSGSIVGLHQACQSLRTRESSMALASGVNLILSPEPAFGMTKLHMLNNTGRSYPFDSRGSGYGRGEGVTTVLLKRLDDALREGDRVRAIIRNTAVNQDGKTNGITLPSQSAQESLQKSIYQSVGLDPGHTCYVEAHGTGTETGDRAELQGISNIFCKATHRSSTLYVGSIKSNIGHLESSSGLAGLIKTVLVLEKGYIPPNADFRTIKPSIKLKDWKIKIPSTMVPWSAGGTRQASVNSFGYGGTNAHVILESAYVSPSTVPHGKWWTVGYDNNIKCYDNHILKSNGALMLAPNADIQNWTKADNAMSPEVNGAWAIGRQVTSSRLPVEILAAGRDSGGQDPLSVLLRGTQPQLFILSANSRKSCHEVAERLAAWAASRHNFEDYFQNLAFTLSDGRSMMHWRYSFVASSHKELLASLGQKTLRVKNIPPTSRISFVFTGQGAQWYAMGRELIFTQSRFAESLVSSDKILRGLGASWSLVDELLLDEKNTRINQSDIAQPASTALQIALTDLLNSVKIKPQMVMGHSSGEIAAAYAAGILSQAMALKVSYCRSQVTNICKQINPIKGAMLAVGLGQEDIMPLLSKMRQGIINLACVNSPSSTTVSGDEPAVLELQDMLNQLNVFNKRLHVETAYHSHHMRKVADEYMHLLGELETSALAADIKFISTVESAEKGSGFGSSYWVQNLVSTVRFSDTLQEYWRLVSSELQSMRSPTDILIEVGPHGVLAGPIRQTLAQLPRLNEYVYLPTLTRNRNSVYSVMELVGKLFENDYTVDLNAINLLTRSAHAVYMLQDLPTYPWDHSATYWHESRLSHNYRFRSHPCHDLLGCRVPSSSPLEPSWRHIISVVSLPWLAEHVIDGLVIFPGSGYICMAIEAARQVMSESKPLGDIQGFSLEDISFSKALVIPPSPQKVEILLSLRSCNSTVVTQHSFRIYALAQDGQWCEHCRGLIEVQLEPSPGNDDLFRLKQYAAHPEEETIGTGQEANCQKLSSQNLYSQFRANGNVYGPHFAAISNLKMGEYYTNSEVVIPDIQSIMPFGYIQPHVVHPTTLDALMHSSLPLYEKHHGQGSVVPVSIGALYVSSKLPNTQGQTLLVKTTLSSNAFRSAKISMACFDAGASTEHEPVLTASQVELRGLGETRNNLLKSPPKHKTAFKMQWAPDVDYISLRSLGSLSKQEYLKRLSFKSSEMTVLQIGVRPEDVSGSFLQLFHGLLPESVKRYDLADMPVDLFRRAQDSLQDWHSRMYLSTLDIRKNPIDQGFLAHSYDLIVAANSLQPSESLGATLTHICKLLKPSGRLVIIIHRSDDLSQDGLHNALIECRFSGLELALNDIQHPDSGWSTYLSRPVSPDNTMLIPPIEIVAEDEMEKLAGDLAYKLADSGLKTSLKSWGNDLAGRKPTCLVLDNGRRPLLSRATPERFKQVLALFGERSNVLWVNVPGQTSAIMNPEKGLITGLARTALAENESLNLITFDIQDAINSWPQEILHIIRDILMRSFNTVSPTSEPFEREIAYRHGQVLIPRLISCENMNNWMARLPSMDPATQGKPGGPHGTPFLGNGESSGASINPSMVQIAVIAYGLNCRNLAITLGRVGSPMPPLFEFAGIVKAAGSEASAKFKVGDRVCSWKFEAEPHPSLMSVDGEYVYHLPDTMPLEVGAVIPFSFMAAYYTLVEIGELERERKILILGAGSGIGQAAIAVALHIGAEVVAVVSNSAERKDIIARFTLPETHVFAGVESNCLRKALKLTQARGVDFVLNTLNMETISDIWACMTDIGTYIQIAQPQNNSNNHLRLPSLDPNPMFVLFDPMTLLNVRPHKGAAVLKKAMSVFAVCSHVPIQQVTTISMGSIEDGTQLTKFQQIIGELVLVVENSAGGTVMGRHCEVAQLDGNATYVIAGGLGDLGQRICRLLAHRGAKYMVILSRRSLDTAQTQELQDRLQLVSPSAKVYSIACDISRKSMIESVARFFEEMNLPSVKGIIQCATVLQDCVLERMTSEKFNVPLRTKMYGTKHLSEVFSKSPLDFFIMLSSLSGIVGSRGQANYAAGNAFQDAFAQGQENSKTHYMSLDLGMIEGSSAYENDEGRVRIENLLRQGWIPIKPEEFTRTLDYAISPSAHRDGCKQAMIGIDRTSLNKAVNATPTTRSGMFVHVRGSVDDQKQSESTATAHNRKKNIKDARSLAEVHEAFSTAIVRQLSNLIVLDSAKISKELPLMSYGLDSLTAIELKNWFAQELDTAIQASEILDSPSVLALAIKAASRSALVQLKSPDQTEGEWQEFASGMPPEQRLFEGPLVNGDYDIASTESLLPKLPLPDLNDTLELYIDCAQSFLSDEELKRTCGAIKEFRDGIGLRLQQKLLERMNDPNIDNWQYDLQVNSIYLDTREPVYPFGIFYGSHLLTEVPHSQPERAAVISLDSLKFMQRLNAGELKQDFLNEEPLCMNSLQWLFNTARQPFVNVDKVSKQAPNEYLITLRRGHIFKVYLTKEGKTISYGDLKTVFQMILNNSDEELPAVATLTADERQSWAELRTTVRSLRKENDSLITMVEGAAFIICLDDESPETATERCNQFLLGPPSNRWSDKSLQFVICANGVSGYICEHSMLDASSIKQLNSSVTDAILAHQPEGASSTNAVVEDDSQPKIDVSNDGIVNRLEGTVTEFRFAVNPIIEGQITRVQIHFKKSYTPAEFMHCQIPAFGNKFLRSRRIAPRTGYQLIIQLASLLYFGRQHPSWETITKMHFHKGRLDWIQAVSPAMFQFCKAASSPDVSSSQQHKLLREAATVHTNTMARIARGKGFAGHLECLKAVLHADESMPALFEDPTWRMMRVNGPRKIKTDSIEGLRAQEAGFLMPDLESVFVHYEMGQDECLFYVQSTEGRTERFCDMLRQAVEKVRGLLEMDGV